MSDLLDTKSSEDLSHWIKAAAKALGFEKVGIIPATALTPEDHALSTWLENNFHADMAWMKDRYSLRVNPQHLMEGAQSIVCVGINYHIPNAPTDEGLKIAQYAQGIDYHRVIKQKLKQLLRQIQEKHPQAKGRALTDSAPILEKALAIRAGIGWQGKNANIITRDYGSWLFLGELLLDIPLAYEETPHNNFCGTCTRCIDACPTQAIVSDGVVDANKCLSYWTIESKAESIPQAIAKDLNGWVFGCDICQDVCPWNISFQQPTTEPDFQPLAWRKAFSSSWVGDLTPETFGEAFRHSPVKRTKLAGLQRNVQTALQK